VISAFQGPVLSLSCGDSLFYDGQSYNTVQIGAQCWMAQNLNIGTMIDISGDQTDNGTIEKYCYNNNILKCDTYGGLYQWDEMMNYISTESSKGICPIGWHLPSDADWCILENFVDAGTISCNASGYRGTDAGSNLKEAGWLHWIPVNAGATNSSAFTGLPGGMGSPLLYDYYFFGRLSYDAYFWTSTNYGSDQGWCRLLNDSSTKIRRENVETGIGMSVRCIQD